jgi:glycosyltransferase involved in cell wall biosynthesis
VEGGDGSAGRAWKVTARKETPRVSVLIDTYNYGGYIEEAIESVLGQDFPAEEMEILVVDDGSTDDTAERVKKYGERVRYLYKSNGGQGSAFNHGFAEARGEIIAFLDADDYWLPGKLRRVMEEFEKGKEMGLVHHRLRELEMETGEMSEGPFWPVSGDLSKSVRLLLTFHATPTTSLALRRTVLEKILPMPETIRIQADAYLEALAPLLAPVAVIDECLAVYRIHATNLYFLSGGVEDAERRKRRAAAMRAIVEGLREWFGARGYEEKEGVARATLSRWTTLLEREEFEVERPGRVRFFRHLLEAQRNHLTLTTRRIRMVNYADAMAALVVGYEGFAGYVARREAARGWWRRVRER